ncbi:hypothetical protein [Burkholderia pseudomallei]|uniref:hypothetical protein n=1 Tax=Burkholderia pseudomallei TaxID=28450 RepID=UPI0021172591|nr:hypothetical protein [Burkholderia pseudomallei]
MRISRISIVFAIIAPAIAPAIAHAQMNQIFGTIHSVQYAVTEVKNLMPQQDTAQQQAQQAQQQRIDYLKQHPPCNANCPLDADDKQKYEAMQRAISSKGSSSLTLRRRSRACVPT